MDLHDCFELEDLFPRSFTDYEERSYGILFFNTQNKDSFDSNHAVIFRDRIKNITTVLEDIVDFYYEKKLTPMIYQATREQGYFSEIAEELSDAGFDSWTEEQKFMVLTAENTIRPNTTVTVRRTVSWDPSFEQIFAEAEEPWETEVARRSLADPDTAMWVSYSDERPIGILYCIKNGNACRLNYVLVSKLHRNAGAGRTLTYNFIEWCRENAIQKVFLWPNGKHPEKIYFEGGFRYAETVNAGRALYRGWYFDDTNLKG